MKERIKTAALLLNVLLLAALFVLSASISIGVSPGMGPLYTASRWLRGESAPIQPVREQAQAAVYPIRLTAVHGPDQLASACTRQQIEPRYEQIRSTLEEALGSAQPPQQISSSQYWQLLTGNGAFLLEYDGQPPLYALRAWAGGAESPDFDLQFSRLVLAIDRGQAALALEDDQGRCWLCQTAAGQERLREALDQWPPEGALFARDVPGCRQLAADQVVEKQGLSLPVYDTIVPASIAATAGGGDTPRTLLECFSINPYLAKRYQGGDGAAVFVQGNYVLRVYGSGRLELSVDGGEGLGKQGLHPPGSQAQAVALVDQTRSVAEAVMEASGAPMDLSLTSISPLSPQGDYTIVLGCQTEGAPVKGLTVTARAKEGVIVWMEMTVITLERTGETTLLPARQAAAALGAQARQARLFPRYSWQEGRLTPYLSYRTQGKEG